MKQVNGPIALFGTSADPPTCGHQALLEGLLKLFPKVLTWASNNPIKHHKASLETRKNLLNLLVQAIADPNLILAQDLSSPWAINTLQKASHKWPDKNLIFIVGSDLTSQVPTWVDAQNIFKIARLGIVPREGWPIHVQELETLKSLGAKVDLVPLTIPNTASSSIRNMPKQEQIPKSILPVLFEENLYGISENK